MTTSARPTVQQHSLENGLELVWEEDHRQPLIAIEVRIKGGLRAEGRYLGTGITHCMEHMLFKGTTTRPPGTIDQEVRRYGGTINAFTSYDTTGVSLFVESRYLREALGMLADILQHAVFDQAEFEKERAVIISEIQMNLDDPDRRVHQLFWSRHFLEHPYRHPILGYQARLEQLTVQDLSAFYTSQYQPQNIVISCVGDLQGQGLMPVIQELFGPWQRGTIDPLQHVVPQEPPTASAKEASIELQVQAGYELLGFSSVRLSDPDLYALDVLAGILGQGYSSRLYETIVRKQQLAHAISAWNYTPYDPGVFGIQLRTDPEKLNAATKAIIEVIQEIQQQGVTDTELTKAKRSVSANYLFSLQTIEAKAADLADSLTATGDPLFSRQYVTGVERVTAEQVQRVAQQYCNPGKMTTAVIRPLTAHTPATTTAEKPGQIPPVRTRLANGASTIIGVDHSLPIAAVVIAFRGGVRVETEDSQGISNLVAQLLTKGTAKKGALEIAQQVESLGGHLEAFSGRDGFGLFLQLLAPDLGQGLALMHELVTQSTFPDPELAIQRQLILKELQAQDDEIFDVGGRLLRRTLFEHHPYRFNPLGSKETVNRFTRDDCVNFAKRWVATSNMVVTVFGDVEASAVKEQIDRSFGKILATGESWPATLTEEPLAGVREMTHHMDREQVLIMLGFRGSSYTATDRYAVDLMTAILSGMAGRLFQAVREEHGLSYTLGAVHVAGWDPGYLVIYAATRPSEQPRVLEVLDEELQRTRTEGFTQEEVDQAKRYLIGLHRLDVQHLVGLSKRVALDELYGLGFDAWTHYEDRINSITVDMVNGVAKRYLTMQQRAQVIISPHVPADSHAQ